MKNDFVAENSREIFIQILKIGNEILADGEKNERVKEFRESLNLNIDIQNRETVSPHWIFWMFKK